MNIKSILKNKILIYLGSRYVTYFLNFVTSMVIAAELGPYYMGIWGFILLLLNYFQKFHFGITNSFNVLYVQHRDNKEESDNYIANTMVLVSFLAILVVVFYLYTQIVGIGVFEKYNADKYIIWVCLIAIFQYFVQFFVSLLRVKNKLNSVTFCQSIIIVLNFLCIFFFRDEELILWLVAGYVVGNILCILVTIFSRTLPDFRYTKISSIYLGEILKKGLFLFLYNSCFYFIIISIRTIISKNYSVEEFGIFTFSFSLAHAALMTLEALTFVVFPKVIGKLSSPNPDEIKSTIHILRTSYITTSHFLIYLVLPLFPLVLYFMPKYTGGLTSMNLIALTVLMQTSSSGFEELLVARNREKTISMISTFALILNIGIALVFVHYFNVGFSYVIIATTITYFMYTLIISIIGFGCLSHISVKQFVKIYFPLRLFIPYVIALVLSIIQYQKLMFLPVVLFVIFNWKTSGEVIGIMKKLIVKPEVVNL